MPVEDVRYLYNRIESLKKQLEDSKQIANNRKLKIQRLVHLTKKLKHILSINGIEYTD